MGEAWNVLSSFIADTGATAEETENATAELAKFDPVETPLDKGKDSPTRDKIKRTQSPKLEVIDGGLEDTKPKKKAGIQKVLQAADNIPTDLPDLPTPGGISLVLILVLFLLFAVARLPQGGTRLQLLFASLLGRASIGQASSGQGSAPYRGQSQTVPQALGGGGNSGNTSTFIGPNFGASLSHPMGGLQNYEGY